MTNSLLFDPTSYDPEHFDPETRRLLRALIEWFESRGKKRLLEDDLEAVWPDDFLEFVKREKLFAKFLTPADLAGGDPDKRWDAARNAALSEIFGFYGLAYWYAWQVTILGLGPIWMSGNRAAKERAAELLDDGGVLAFGLSEKEHGADVYSTDMLLTPADNDPDLAFTASGDKYYIGNGNVAGMVSVFGRRTDVEGSDGYVFFVADSRHPAYHLQGNVVHGQMYVSTFRLEDYPVREEDILHTGVAAFEAALNTVNVGKFNLCTGSIGISEHAFYESITHAHNRILYGNPVTDFAHVRGNFVDAYSRLIAMKLFSARSVDYFRSASLDDRRYLLFNPMTKAKVTSEGEKVIALLHDVIAAKGYEKNTYFREAAQLIGTLPKLEAPCTSTSASSSSSCRTTCSTRRSTRRSAPGSTPPTMRSSGSRARPRCRQDSFPRLGEDLRGALGRPQRGPLPRAGDRAEGTAHHRPARRGPAEGSRLPARPRALVLARGLRAPDSRAGHDRRHRP